MWSATTRSGRFLLDYFRQHNVGSTHINVNEKHPSSVACLPVYKRDGKRAVYCAQGWNAHFIPDAAVDAYDAILLGYPHVMPALRGAPLAQFASRCVEAGTCLCLDVNEASDDYKMPLGDASAYENIGVLHGNLDEAAACVGRKKEFLERYNIRDGLENVLSMAEVESIARALLRRGCGVVLFTLGPLGAFAMTNDEPTLRRTLGRIEHGLLPSHVSRRAAFKADGAIDTVGAGAVPRGRRGFLVGGGDPTACWTWGLAAALWRVDALAARGRRAAGGAPGARWGLERPTVARTVGHSSRVSVCDAISQPKLRTTPCPRTRPSRRHPKPECAASRPAASVQRRRVLPFGRRVVAECRPVRLVVVPRFHTARCLSKRSL